MVVILAALFSMAISGNYRLGANLLLGPSLFFAVLIPRTATSGVVWMYGGEVRDTKRVQEELDKLLEADGNAGQRYQPRVASVYLYFDRLTSSIVQNFIAVIERGRERSDLRFVAQAEIISSLFRPEHTAGRFEALLNGGLMAECSQLVEAGTAMVDANTPTPERQYYARAYERLLNYKVRLQSKPARDFVLSMYPVFPELFAEAWETPGSTSASGAPSQFTFQPDCYSKWVLKSYGGSTAPWLDENMSGDCRWTDEKRKEFTNNIWTKWCEQYNQKKAALAELPGSVDGITNSTQLDNSPKYQQAKAWVENGMFRCHQLWNFVLASAHYESIIKFNNVMSSRVGVIPKDERSAICADPSKWGTELDQSTAKGLHLLTGFESPSEVINEIAKALLKEELEKTGVWALATRYGDQTETIRDVGVPVENDLALMHRKVVKASEGKERQELMQYAATLPYYEGVALFFLTAGWPFFMLLLLIPGNLHGALSWFAFYLWVRSWEVVMPLCSILVDVVYSLSVANNQTLPDGAKGLHPDLSAALFLIRNTDPMWKPDSMTMIHNACAVSLGAAQGILGYYILSGLGKATELIQHGNVLEEMRRLSGSDTGTGGGPRSKLKSSLTESQRLADGTKRGFAARDSEALQVRQDARRLRHSPDVNNPNATGPVPVSWAKNLRWDYMADNNKWSEMGLAAYMYKAIQTNTQISPTHSVHIGSALISAARKDTAAFLKGMESIMTNKVPGGAAAAQKLSATLSNMGFDQGELKKQVLAGIQQLETYSSQQSRLLTVPQGVSHIPISTPVEAPAELKAGVLRFQMSMAFYEFAFDMFKAAQGGGGSGGGH